MEGFRPCCHALALLLLDMPCTIVSAESDSGFRATVNFIWDLPVHSSDFNMIEVESAAHWILNECWDREYVVLDT